MAKWRKKKRILKSKKRTVMFVLAMVIVIALSLFVFFRDALHITNITSAVIKPIGKLVDGTKTFFIDNIESFGDNKNLIKDNRELSKEVEELKTLHIRVDILEHEVDEYKRLLNIRKSLDDYEIIPVERLYNNTSRAIYGINVDKGIHQGVNKSMPVVFDDYLVGVVSSSDLMTAKIRTVYDKTFQTMARDRRTGEILRLSGQSSVGFIDEIIGDYLKPRSEIQVGDIIETTSLGGIYPDAIKIGEVKDIIYDEDGYAIEAIIEPYLDLWKMDVVYVLSPKEEIDND